MAISPTNLQAAVGILTPAESTVALGEMDAVRAEGSASVNRRGAANARNPGNPVRSENRGRANLNRGTYEAVAEVSVGNVNGRGNTQRPTKSSGAPKRGGIENNGNFCAFPNVLRSQTASGANGTVVPGRARIGANGNLNPQSIGRTSPGTQPQRNVAGNQMPSTANGNKPVVTNAVGGKQGSIQPNTSTGNVSNKTAIAPSAAEIAKDRSTMLSTVDKALDSTLGAGKYTKPTDHRGYTALVQKAMKSLKTPEEKTAFRDSIELAGKPFRLNFGLTKQVNGKPVALNANVTGTMAQGYQAERGKFYQEFLGKTNTSGRAQTSTGSTTSGQGSNNGRVAPMNRTPSNSGNSAPSQLPTNTVTPKPKQTPGVTPMSTPTIYNPRSFLIA
jgi:hypothetical protein